MKLGPLIAAAVLAFSGTTAAFGVAAALSVAAGALLVHLSYEAPQHSSSLELRRIIIDTSAGFGALWRHRDAGLLIGLALAQTFTRGCLCGASRGDQG